VIRKLRDAPDHLTVSVYVEDGTGGRGSSEIPDLVICGDKCVDEVGGSDNGKAEGEKQSCEGDERHGEGTRGWMIGIRRRCTGFMYVGGWRVGCEGDSRVTLFGG